MSSPDRSASAIPNGRAEPLRLRGLTKTFDGPSGTVVAVDSVDLDIEGGEFLTLLGPSGCGKTTMLRMIAGFETPASGTIELGGRNVATLPANKRPMAMVFQNYALFPHLSVAGNVSYGLKVQKKSREEIAELVDMALVTMNLNGLADRDPHQLSGGQQQRVALARAMVMKPEVLLFDEPLSNLDAKLRVQMRNEIRELQQRMGITSIYVTHDQEEAMALSDRIVVMNKGQVAQVGVPADLYLRPTNVFVADFLGTANFLDVVVGSVDGTWAKVDVLGQRRSVRAHPGVDPANRSVLMIRPETLTVSVVADGEANGVVRSTAYLGARAEIRVETPDAELVAVSADPDPETLPVRGDSVFVSFDGERSYLLPN
jgi:iron(III) transport system ATP-binding protein